MSNVLVTGGAGFIGSNFCNYWVQNNLESRLIVLDALTYAGNPYTLEELVDAGSIDLVAGSINDRELVYQLLSEHNISNIIHFAAESHVDRSIENPDIFLETNILGTHTLLNESKRYWMDEKHHEDNHRFHHVSTDEVYGSLSLSDDAFTETTSYAPNSPYSASKAASDFMVRAYHHTYGMNITMSNCSNNYGPYHFPEKLIPLTIINCLNGKTLPVYGKGDNIRDWLHVSDHARAIHKILEHGRNGETYNVGGNSERTNIDIVNIICSVIDEMFSNDQALQKKYPNCPASKNNPCSSLIEFVTDRAGHDFRYAIDASKLENELSFSPEVIFEVGLASTIEWYVNNDQWWEDILSGAYRQHALIKAS